MRQNDRLVLDFDNNFSIRMCSLAKGKNMFKKLLTAFWIAVMLSLFGSGQTLAADPLPTWEVAFDPGEFTTGTYYMVHSVEEYKGDLYVVAGDAQWFHWGEPSEMPGQVFRSPDGKNWQPASEPGFGLGAVDDMCGTNTYDTAWDMTVFNDKLYVLPFESCYNRPGVIQRSSDGATWEVVATTEEFGLAWEDMGTMYYGQFHKFGVMNGWLYVGIDTYDLETAFTTALVFRSPTGDPGTWEKVVTLPGWGGAGSFHFFRGALYLASDSVYYSPDWTPAPDQIWRTLDGVNWEMVVGDGFGNPGTDSLGGFADYKGYLYVGTGMPGSTGGQIWRTRDGLAWEPVVMDGFGNPLDEKVDGLVVYLGDLYAYTVNYTEGGSVFRTSDALTWTRVNEPGWGNPTHLASHLESDQVVFKDDLYMGVVGPQGVLMKLVHPQK